jgi:hypothetical protein
MDFTQIYKKYKGLWVALTADEKKVVGSGSTLQIAIEKAKKEGEQDQIMFKVPTKLVPYVASCYEVSLQNLSH